MTPSATLHFTLDNNVTKAASYAPAAVDFKLHRFSQLTITLNIVAAERDSANETYDFYIINGDGFSEWDIVHFPQVITTGAKSFTAKVIANSLPQNVTSAAPGVAANDPSIIQTNSGALNAPKSLTAGSVRHGPFGGTLRYELVAAGTIATGIQYSIVVTATSS